MDGDIDKLTGRDRWQGAYRFFLAKGWTPAQAAGIVGGLRGETANLSPTQVHDNGIGLGISGWNKDRLKALRSFAKQRGETAPSLATQLEFVDHELRNTETVAGGLLSRAKSPREAGQAMLTYFRPKDWNKPGSHPERARYAQEAFNSFNSPWEGVDAINAAAPVQAATTIPNAASAFTADGGGNLLGEWIKASAPAAGPAPAEPENLLGEWLGTLAPESPPLPKPRPAEAPARVAPEEIVAETGLPELASQMAGSQRQGILGVAERGAGGAIRGIGDVADTLAQGIAATGEKGAGLLERIGVISPESTAATRGWAEGVRGRVEGGRKLYRTAAGDSTAADIGRIGGQILATAPALAVGGAAVPASTRAALAYRSAAAGTPLSARAAAAGGNALKAAIKGAAAGAGATALTSAASDEPLSDQMVQGAAVGSVLGPAGRAASAAGGKLAGLVTGKVDPLVASLAKEARDRFGIRLSATQISDNKMIRFMDSVLQRTPLTGYGARTAEQTAAFNRALAAEMGETADRITPDTIKNAYSRLGNTYRQIEQSWTQHGTVPADAAFMRQLSRIERNAKLSLDESSAKGVANLVAYIKGKVDPNTGLIDGRAFGKFAREKGPLKSAISSGRMEQYPGEIERAIDALAQRVNPAVAATKKNADYQYWLAKSLEKAAEGSPIGQLSPAKVFTALKGAHTDAPRKLGAIGAQFLQEPPSSGTAERRLIASALAASLPAAALGGVGYYSYDPDNVQAMLAKGALGLGGLLALRYGASPLMRSDALANAVINRSLPGGAAAIARPNELAKLLRAGSVPAAALTFRGP